MRNCLNEGVILSVTDTGTMLAHIQAWSSLVEEVKQLQQEDDFCQRKKTQVEQGLCRRPILSGLLCSFSFWTSGPFVTSFEFGPRTLSIFYFIESLSSFELVIYFMFISYLIIICR